MADVAPYGYVFAYEEFCPGAIIEEEPGAAPRAFKLQVDTAYSRRDEGDELFLGAKVVKTLCVVEVAIGLDVDEVELRVNVVEG